MKKLFKSLFVDLFFGWSLPQVLWLIFSQVSLFYFSILWDDAPHALIAAQAGMLYTILAGKGKAACFLFGIINTPLYAYISYVHGYYGDFALNVYYFFMMFIGLNAWLRNASQSAVEGIVRTQLSNKGRCILLGVCFLLTFVLDAINLKMFRIF